MATVELRENPSASQSVRNFHTFDNSVRSRDAVAVGNAVGVEVKTCVKEKPYLTYYIHTKIHVCIVFHRPSSSCGWKGKPNGMVDWLNQPTSQFQVAIHLMFSSAQIKVNDVSSRGGGID